ncbi:hypothetical protein HP546_21285 [Pseudomonas sp. CM25]|uniref:hypothetical protein n=1 Tax=Pseudomonas sp. CM25 TaxID=2738448 RepID=UPI0015570697|nr:hypothetical protein [Pseudomonas sp. CM25]NQD57872.1 hypothetical protein [Pseudomonas sp. CM25]
MALCQASLAFWLDLYPYRAICPARQPDRETMNTHNFKKLFMPDISVGTASLIHAIASATAVIAALIAASAMIIAHMTSDVKTQHSETTISQASQEITVVNESAVQAQLEIQQLTEQNDALKAELEREKAERLKLEASLKPRKLTPLALDAFKALAGELTAKTLKPVVLLNILKDDKEAVQFAKEIAVALTKAGVQVQIKQLPQQKHSTGTQVVVYAGAGSDELEQAFKAADFASDIKRSGQSPRVKVDDGEPIAISAFISVYPRTVI